MCAVHYVLPPARWLFDCIHIMDERTRNLDVDIFVSKSSYSNSFHSFVLLAQHFMSVCCSRCLTFLYMSIQLYSQPIQPVRVQSIVLNRHLVWANEKKNEFSSHNPHMHTNHEIAFKLPTDRYKLFKFTWNLNMCVGGCVMHAFIFEPLDFNFSHMEYNNNSA